MDATEQFRIADWIGSDVTRLLIDTSGNVGIGTVAPNTLLHIKGAVNERVYIKIEGSGGAADAAIQFTLGDEAATWTAGIDDTENRFSIAEGTQLGTNDRLTILSGGNVGIGDNLVAPQHRLHVSGDAIISGVLYDSTNSSGVAGHVFTSEVGGPQWKMIEDVLSGVGGNGTANYVPKWEDSDTIGNSIIYESGSAIGIGTDTPSGKFNVRGDSVWMGNASTDASSRLMFAENAAGSQGFSLLYAGALNPTIDGTAFTAAANSFNIYRHDNSIPGISAITIKRSNGKVGIGTGGPVQQLHVVGDAIRFERTDNAVALQLYNNNASPGDDAALGYVQFMGKDNDGTASIVHSEVRGGVQSNSNTAVNGYLAFLTTNNGTAVTEWMRITSDGKVGIGTNAPTSISASTKVLHLYGTNAELKAETNNGGGWAFSHYKTPTDSWTVGADNDDKFRISSGTNLTADARLTILGDGKVGIGDNAPETRLHIKGDFDASSALPGGDIDANKGLNIEKRSGVASDYSIDDLFGVTFQAASNGESRNMAAIYASVPNVPYYVAGKLYFCTSSGDNLGSDAASGPQKRMTIDEDGNVGIGTNAPGFMLQVDEDTTATYAASIRNANDNLQLKLGTTTGALLNIQGSTISTDAAYDINLQAAGG